VKRTISKIGGTLAVLVLAAAPVFADHNTPAKTLDQQVRHELLMLPYYTIFDDVSYRVDGSTVYLAGDVRQPWLKTNAEKAVKGIAGVTGVVNDIRVLPPSSIDNRIRFAEYRAVFGYGGLYRYAMGPNPPVRIIVDGGHVKLVGYVATEMDRNVAGIRANGVPGVFSVDNDLMVAPKAAL
jgi:hyperosmotically inducible protein